MEEIVLLAVWRLQKDAYGLAIRREIIRTLEKEVSVSSVYVPLERLARQGFLETRDGAPTAKRGGRRKKYYKISAEGLSALAAIQRIHSALWEGIPKFNVSSG